MIIEPCFVDKGWGYEEILTNTDKYCAKILHVNKNKKMSWHFHKIKDETFFVETGLVELYFGDDDNINSANKIILSAGKVFHVPVGLRHMLVGLANSRVFEFSTQHFENDSYRILKGD
jgi:mannose-6-phosphate isomerase-like protein (cupin superfamily)